jgi:glycosyltransferase involved in cell wall biosynthesis
MLVAASATVSKFSAASGTARKLRVHMVSPRGRGGSGGIDRLADLISQAAPSYAVDIKRVTTRGNRSLAWAPLSFAHALWTVWRDGRAGWPDVVHINLASKGSAYRKIVLAALARRLGIPYVVHLHGGGFGRFWESVQPLMRRAIGGLFANSARVIVLGECWAGVVRKYAPETATRIVVLPNATPLATSRRRCADRLRLTISFIGQLNAPKGVATLLEALSMLKTRTDWTATLAGDGSVKQWREMAITLGISDRVEFPGWVDAAGVASLLERTDVFILPSFTENLPMALLEAFAHCIACIATPVGAIPDVIQDGRNGLLTPVGDASTLADNIRRLLDNRGLRETLASAALQDHRERYSLDAYMVRLIDIWSCAAGMRAGPKPGTPLIIEREG